MGVAVLSTLDFKPQVGVALADTKTRTADPATVQQGTGTKFYINYDVTLNYAGTLPPPDLVGDDTSRGPVASDDMFGPRAPFEIEGKVQYNFPTGPYGHAPYGFADHLLVKNDPAWTGSTPTTRQITPAWIFMNSRAWVGDSSAISFTKHDAGYGAVGFVDTPLIFTAATGTIDAMEGMVNKATGVHAVPPDREWELTSFLSFPAVFGGSSVARRIGFDVADVSVNGAVLGPYMDTYYGDKLSGTADTGVGLVWQQIGLRVPRLIMAVDNIGIQCDSPIRMYDSLVYTETSTTPPTLIRIGTSAEVTLTGASTLLPQCLTFSPTVIVDTTVSAFSAPSLFLSALVLKSGANTTNRNFRQLWVFRDNTTITADQSDDTMVAHTSIHSQPIFSTTGAGTPTLAITNLYHLRAGAVSVGAGVTLAARTGVLIENWTGAGTVVDQCGIDIQSLTGAGANIGIRNRSRSVYPPSTQVISAATDTITAASSFHTLTATGSFTMTSTPTIVDGEDGQLLCLANVDTTDTITLQDQGTLPGSNMRMAGATYPMGPRDSTFFIYSAAVGDWLQLSQWNVT